MSHPPGILGSVISQITSGPTLPYAILVLALLLAPRLAEIVRLPAMVGLVLAGMILGSHGTRLLASKEIALSAIGEFGLLYLMFSAGLELDLKLFMKMKKAAITFAFLSFAIPFKLGIVSARFLGYRWAAAILMGSNWGSHTLVTYPLLRQMGLSRNRAVATVVGATAVTDTSALLVLSVVSGTVKPTGALGVQLAGIVIGLGLLSVWSLLALPRVARWFFARVGTDRSYRFIFGIAAFLVGGVLAEAAGIDAIVGAFFAGLGLNRAIPEESPLMDRLQFTGSTFFIPIFLVSVGRPARAAGDGRSENAGHRARLHGGRFGRQDAGGHPGRPGLPVQLARDRGDVWSFRVPGSRYARDDAGGGQAGPVRQANDQRGAGRHPRFPDPDACAGHRLRKEDECGRGRRVGARQAGSRSGLGRLEPSRPHPGGAARRGGRGDRTRRQLRPRGITAAGVGAATGAHQER